MAREGGDLSSNNVLPEGCAAKVLSFTSPRDACRLSAVFLMFKSAAKSDVVWEKFLPHDYESIISKSDNSLLLASIVSLKKQLHHSLCDKPIFIENGKNSFSLSKRSGKKCFMLSARSLEIAWGENRAHWRWDSDPESRFLFFSLLLFIIYFLVAHLLRVHRLEILGKINASMLSPETWYTTYLVFKFTVKHYRSNQKDCYSLAYELDDHPAKVSIGVVGGDTSFRIVFLNAKGWQRQNHHFNVRRPTSDGHCPKDRGDGWSEMELGDFLSKEVEDGELEVGVIDNSTDNWKGGLTFEGIEIRPKEGN